MYGPGLDLDFHLLVLAAVYHADGLWGEATFDLYPRDLPPDSGYLVAGGVEEAIDAALSLRFRAEEIAWLQGQEVFARATSAFWDALESFAFEGEILAMPEGTLCYPGEPILRVTAPLVQATLIETRLLRAVSAGTAVATRASRLVGAARGRRVADFGSRRLPSADAARLAARAALVGGCASTTNAEAASRLGVPTIGTLNAGFFAAYGDDRRALEAFRVHFPESGFVDLPEGDPAQGLRALAPYRKLLRLVRLDRPDLGPAARQLRAALDENGMKSTRILGSGSLDEEKIRALGDAPLDLLAVGRAISAGEANLTWRLAEVWRGPDPEPATHSGSARYPGRKQVFRKSDHDLIALEDEEESGTPLLERFVSQGERVREEEPVLRAQARCLAGLAALPAALRLPRPGVAWPLKISDRLAELALS